MPSVTKDQVMKTLEGVRDPELSGNVVVPAPATKNDVTKSSNENVNASSPPARIAGASRGSVTWRKVWSGPAPRSYEAS